MSRAGARFSDHRRLRVSELQRRLLELGLARGPRRLLRRSSEGLSREDLVAGLATVLAEFGGPLAAFAAYLGSRGDYFSARECLRLGAVRGDCPPASWASIRERLGDELGVAAAEAFADLDSDPVASDWLLQAHRGVLADGSAVVLRVVRPGADSELTALGERLAPLERVRWPAELDFSRLVEDFRCHLEARIDLARQAEHLEVLASATEGSDLVRVAAVLPALCSSRVLSTTYLAGRRWDDPQADLGAAEQAELSRRLSLVWLQLALVARAFPVTAEWVVLADGRWGIRHGTFASLPATSQVRLWNYLRAAAAHQPERAANYLLREMVATRRTSTAAELRLRLRQAVPFRDGAWSRRGDSLAEHAMLHWRLAREAGYRGRADLRVFFRGLVESASLAHRLDPQRDTLGEALNSLQWLAGWSQFRTLSSPRRLAPMLEQGTDLLLDLPQKIDLLLDLSESPEGFQPPLERGLVAEGHRDRWTVAGALGAMMLAVVLATPALLRAGLESRWVETGAAVTFLLLGGFLLRVLAVAD